MYGVKYETIVVLMKFVDWYLVVLLTIATSIGLLLITCVVVLLVLAGYCALVGMALLAGKLMKYQYAFGFT